MHKIHKDAFNATKRRHIKKLNKLIAQKKKEEYEYSKIVDKWICNLSKHQLTVTECSVQSQSLNFAITPKDIPHKDFILAIKLAYEKLLDHGQKAALRNEIAVILRTTKPPPSNITPSELQATNALSKNNNITILPADKGRTEAYETQMIK